jgi:DNA-binding response OmpR family regulator
LTKVLLAEDDPETLSLYASELERNNFGIITARNGKEAIAKFIEHSPQIVILDHELSNPNALDVLRKILAVRPQTKAMMLTFKCAVLDEAERLGLELFLLKPVSPQLIVRSALALSDVKSRPQLMIVTR